MRKPYNYTILSDRKCTECGKQLKQNLASRKQIKNGHLCYSCFSLQEQSRGNINKRAMTLLNIHGDPNYVPKHVRAKLIKQLPDESH